MTSAIRHASPVPPSNQQRTEESMYTLTDVTKTYRKGQHGVTAVERLNLSIADGEWLAIQGRTGSGKTTLLQLLGALDHPSSGVINFDGRDLARLPEADLTEVRASSIGFVFQTFNLIPTLSARENVEVALIPQGLSADQRREQVAEALASVGLTERASHLPSELSGGQQQRVGIARALVKAPNVLLADEPTGNLDVDTRDEIMALLEALWRDRGLTLVLVTHDTEIARRAQRVATMRDGRLSIATDERAQPDPASGDRNRPGRQ
jgi:putative ABC transport system ATP-binding protein